jgi:putative hydrolase of the HAD superfamily
MTESPIRHVVFDMDGVLCRTDFSRRDEVMAQRVGLTAAAIEAAIFKSGFEDQADRGRFTAEQYLHGMAERLGVAVSRADWLAARKAAMTPDRDMLALARALGRRLGTAMLTNNGPLLRAHIGEVFPQAVELFGARAFFSCEFGTGKEGPRYLPSCWSGSARRRRKPCSSTTAPTISTTRARPAFASTTFAASMPCGRG